MHENTAYRTPNVPENLLQATVPLQVGGIFVEDSLKNLQHLFPTPNRAAPRFPGH